MLYDVINYKDYESSCNIMADSRFNNDNFINVLNIIR